MSTDALKFSCYRALRPTPAALLMAAMFVPLIGCGSNEEALDAGRVISVSSGRKMKFESEQVAMNPEQMTCGIQNELFGEVDQSAARKVAPLLERGRALGFTDDVSVGEYGRDRPNTQVRGTFPLVVKQVVNIKDHPNGAKRVEVWAGVRIDHPCFSGPLQIMGVRRGALSETAPAAFEFAKAEEGWRLVQILHQ